MPTQDIKVTGTIDKDYMDLVAEYEGATVTIEVKGTSIEPLFVIIDNLETILEKALDEYLAE